MLTLFISHDEFNELRIDLEDADAEKTGNDLERLMLGDLGSYALLLCGLHIGYIEWTEM